MGPVPARLLRPPQEPRRSEAERDRRSDIKTRPSRRGLLTGPSDGQRLGRNRWFLACSKFPEHKESRPLPGEEAAPQAGEGEPCPQCGEGTLVGKTGRFGPFVGCSRYPDCNYIRRRARRAGPAAVRGRLPKNGDGNLVARRARRTGNVFWGCSAYPKCDYTTNFEPVGAPHDADEDPWPGRASRASA